MGAASSIVNDPKNAQAVLDPAASALEPLLSESVRCSYPARREDEDPKLYITWFNEDELVDRYAGTDSDLPVYLQEL